MRRAARVDANQKQISDALKAAGATVQPLHMVGRGCPDICVGYRGRNYLLEIKDGAKPPSRQHLTEDEQLWHDLWRGQVQIIKSVDQALEAIGAK